jgi:hypothetical protein
MRTLARSIIVALIALVATGAAVPAMAQGNQTFTQRWYFASDFGLWAVRGQQANTYQWSPGTVCNVSAVGSSTSFFAFSTNAPVLISDITGPTTNNEVVTPSSVTQTNAYCTIAVSPSHNHYSFQVQSGTGGLQEALNAISPTAVVPAVVWLDRNWYPLANAVPSTTPAAIITAAAGGVSAILVDNTTAPFTNYVWQGTAYASGTWVNTAPTAATGAAAGSATSKVATGTALSGTYSFTTGTATTGTVFTETWATSNQFVYSPVCTVISTGATAPPTLTVTPTYAGGTHALLTVTVAAALTSTTAYSFQWACH